MHDTPASEPHLAPAPRLADFDFALPPELIAQVPAERRDAARLMVVERAGSGVAHRGVADLPGLLRRGDLLVCNDVRVRPARIYGRSAGGGAVELLLLGERAGGWEALVRPGRRLRPGATVRLAEEVVATVRERLPSGRALLDFPGDVDVPGLLERRGEIPLPPYIKRPDGPLASDRERYQTVFARRDGAVAAPTAGLHFTEPLLAACAAAGVAQATVTLVVGPATFLPWRDDAPGQVLEGERAEIPAATIAAIARTRAAGGRVIAVGTTTTRALESAARLPGGLGAAADRRFDADVFMVPGFRFQVVDALLTNFHLPRSTLLMLVAAFAGRERILAAYAEAVRAGYRFYSYGDAMLIA
ncbi:MAG: tRNA preQ1(34) S-adenosylmethionine ribosyltransferase-isomerase QueA [Deltaproteobacteria bacterium]|nr:tRNA preQ1(34) S-adenosylmethionine ribosyltransferase-isomerase QueA [Deltaproteobacteria bacterium]